MKMGKRYTMVNKEPLMEEIKALNDRGIAPLLHEKEKRNPMEGLFIDGLVLIPAPGIGKCINVVRWNPLEWEVMDDKTREVLERWSRKNMYSDRVLLWKKEDL